MQNFLDYIEKYVKLSQEEIDLFSEGLVIREFKKKEIILHGGEIAN